MKHSVLPQGRVEVPFNQPYGMGEFHMKYSDGCLLMFDERAQQSNTLFLKSFNLFL